MHPNSGDQRNLSELLGLLAHSNVRVAELAESCRRQRDTGEPMVAELAIIQAHQLVDDIRTLENILRLKPPTITDQSMAATISG
jgi:hypothetical protein